MWQYQNAAQQDGVFCYRSDMTQGTYLYSEFVQTKAGDPFRLFPFGQVVKNGKKHDITPEYAKQFKLPHFKPPIKLGSHEDITAAGGHIVGLEIRPDGLYAVPEWNEKGIKALEDGAYRYNSPEIIWDDGGLEDPASGNWIMGPLVLGDALLHTPHLGEATAMYKIEIKEQSMVNENQVSVPQSLWDKFNAYLESRLTPAEPQRVEIIPEDYEAAKKERDEYKAKLAEREQADALKVRVDKFDADLKGINVNPEFAALLADLPEDKAEQVMKQFRAMSEQINILAFTEETGTEGGAVEDPKAQFNALVLKYAAEKKIGYNQAFDIVKAENAELFTAWAVKEK